MKQTAMQNLREDLVLSQVTAKEALIEIKNQEIRKACQEALGITLKTIIKRIDDELLEMEKQQIIDAYESGVEEGRMRESSEEYNLERYENAERYYNNKFKKK